MFVTPSFLENSVFKMFFCLREHAQSAFPKNSVFVTIKRGRRAYPKGQSCVFNSLPRRDKNEVAYCIIDAQMSEKSQGTISQGTITKVNKKSEITNYQGRRPAAFSTNP